MGSKVVNSCALPTFGTGINEPETTDVTQVGGSCPVAGSKPGVELEISDETTGPSCSAAASNLAPFPLSDPLIKSAIGPLLDVHDPKLLAYARQVAAQQDEPADEKAVRAALGEDGVRRFKDMKNDLAEAHRAFEATGQISQTKHPFAWIEIQTGKMMTQSERY